MPRLALIFTPTSTARKIYLRQAPSNLFVYEIQSEAILARYGPFPGTTAQAGSQFSDWLNPGLSTGSSVQQFGVSLSPPNANGVPGGHLVAIDLSKLRGGVVGQNNIQFSLGKIKVNNLPCP